MFREPSTSWSARANTARKSLSLAHQAPSTVSAATHHSRKKRSICGRSRLTAATKVAAEMLCYTYAHLTHIPIVCLRFFTVYGPRQRPDLAIHKFTALIEAGKPVPIFGDGTTGRDYTYVSDIVAGVVAAARYTPPELEGAFFDVFNLGNSHPIRLNDLVAALERATGRNAIQSPQPLQPGDVPLTWADISKSERLLGYRPATSLEKGLKMFVEWYRAADPKQRA